MSYTYAPSNQPLYVAEGEFLQFRFKAPNDWNTTRTVTIRVGDLDQFWLLTTTPEDRTPDPYPFTNIPADPGAELSTLFTTDVVFNPPDGPPTTSLTGLTPGTEASVALGCNVSGNENIYAMRIDKDGDGVYETGWIQGDGTQVVVNGSKIQVRVRSSEFIVSPVRLTLVIGPASSFETWEIFTRAGLINEPNPFPNFTDLDDQKGGTYCYTPEVIRLQGMIADGDLTLTSPGEWAVSSTGVTTTDANGFQILDGATFTSAPGIVKNGDYLQLRMLSSSLPLTPVTTNISIGTETNGSDWTVRTGNNPSTNPNAFSFPSITGAIEDALIGSATRPNGGISGLGAGISVPVEIVSTDASLVRVKKNNGSIGVFPTTVQNGDTLSIYLQSSPSFSDVRNLQIKVGDRTISNWQVQTSSGPDTEADWTPPPNKINQIPLSFVASNPIAVSGINRPITIESVAGYNALISIDFDTPVLGPRTFDPLVNSTFYIVVQAAQQLGTPETTTIQLGTGDPNQFQWQVTTYVVVPPAANNKGVWYSKKNSTFNVVAWEAAGSNPNNTGDYYSQPKLDGYSIGTVLPILKENVGDYNVAYGDLDGSLSDRYPGFIECDGRALEANKYRDLYNVIEMQYGGNVTEINFTDTVTAVVNGETITSTFNTKTLVGNFNLPDYRNRRMCGVGPVDNQKGNSAQLPTDTGGIDVVGSQGGFWYFNKIGPRGTNPLDQVQGVDQGLEPGSLDSDYFSIGTVRLAGLSTLTEIIPFTVNPNGFVTAQIGPLSSVRVGVPAHDHAYIAAVVESDGGDPLIGWGNSDGRGLMGSNRQSGAKISERSENSEKIWQQWVKFLEDTDYMRSFKQEIILYLGSQEAFEAWVRANFPANAPVNEDPPTFSIDFTPLEPSDFGDTSDDAIFEIEFLTWWLSPASELASATLTNVAPARFQGSSRNWSCVFDTQPTTFRIDNYTSTASGGETLTHRHLITENPVTDIQSDFTGGNLNDEGSNTNGLGSGLGAGIAGSLLTFRMRWSGTYVDINGNKDRTSGGAGFGASKYFSASTGDWGYRNGGGGYWTSPTDEVTDVYDMLGGSGSGMRLEMTFQAWPRAGGGASNNDSRIRVNRIVSAGSGYQVGDIVSTQFWNDIPSTANRILELSAVSDAATGGAATQINLNFTQSDVFMDMTEGLFKYSSAFKRPFPDVIMRPQRQVPILTPFHKSKYIIKAF